MEDELKTKEQLINELIELRQRVSELEECRSTRKRVEEKLQRSEQRFQALVENAWDFFAILDRAGIIRYVNPAVRRQLGYELEELIGKNAFDKLFHPDDLLNVIQRFNYLVDNPRATESAEVRFQHKDGSWRILEATATSLLNDPSLEGIVINSRDITDRKRIEETVQVSEARLRFLLSATPAVLYTCGASPPYAATFISENVRNQLGYEPRQFVEDRNFWASNIHPDHVSHVFKELEGLFDQGHHIHEYRFRHRDGSYRWMLDELKLIRNAAGQPAEIVGYWIDITQRKRTEEALRQSQEDHRELLDSVDCIVWEANARTFQFTFVSKQAERLLGYPVERWLSEPRFWKNHIHPDDRDWTAALCLAATAEKRAHEFEYRMIAADGRTVWLRDIVTVIVEDDQPVKLRGVMLDISERKRAEEALRRSEQRFRVLIASMDDVVFTLDREQRYVEVFGHSADKCGHSPEFHIGKTARQLLSAEAAAISKEANRRALAGEHVIYEWSVDTPAGKRYVQTSLSPIQDSNGEIMGLVGVGRNVTELKRAEEALRALSKRVIEAQEAERRRVARELHDSVNQILSSVKLRIQNLQENLLAQPKGLYKDVEKTKALLEKAMQEVRRISQNLRPSVLDDLGMISAIRSLCDEFRERTRIAMSLTCPRIGKRPAAEVELTVYRILQEALNNVERHSGASRVTVRVLREGPFISLSIRDNGTGFDVLTVLSKKRKKAGLGLLDLKERASLVGGKLDIRSGPRQGTEIVVQIPFKGHIQHGDK